MKNKKKLVLLFGNMDRNVKNDLFLLPYNAFTLGGGVVIFFSKQQKGPLVCLGILLIII